MVALMLNMSLVMVIAPVGAQGTRSLIDRALDQPATIRLDNIRLKDAIEVVTKQTGVPIVMGLEAMRLVPQGADTLINRVDIASMPLREGMRRLFAPLGMRCVIESDRVSIEPRGVGFAVSRGTCQGLRGLGAVSACFTVVSPSPSIHTSPCHHRTNCVQPDARSFPVAARRA